MLRANYHMSNITETLKHIYTCMYVEWSLHFKTTRPLDKYSLKFKMVPKWRHIYIENVRVMLLMASHKMERDS